MKTQSYKHLAENLELWLIGLLLFYFLGSNVLPSLIVKVLNPGSYLITAFLITWRWKRLVYVATRDIPLLLLFGMVAISVFWSANPQSTLIQYKSVLRAMLLGAYLAARYDIKEQMQLFSWVLGITALLSLARSLALPSYGTALSSGAWRGIFAYKNHLAIYMVLAAMLFLLAALNNSRYRWIALTGFGLTATLVFLSKGKTSYIIFMISLCLLPLHRLLKQHYKLRVIVLITTLLLCGIAIVLILSNLETVLVDILGKDLTFNGRTQLWTLSIEQALKRPWLGYGYAGFQGTDESYIILKYTWLGGNNIIDLLEQIEKSAVNVHSGYISMLLQLGFVGSFLYLLNLLFTFTRIIYLWMSTASIESLWMLQSIISIFLFNFADTGGLLSKGTIWILYVSISLSSIIWRNRIKRNSLLSKKYGSY